MSEYFGMGLYPYYQTGNTMSENIDVKVIVLPEAKEEAYRMGFDRFKDHKQEVDSLIEQGEMSEEERHDMSGFHQSATYANHVLLDLRAMAGFRDSGYGTYQIDGKVVTVEFPEDRPMDGEITESHYIFDELIDTWHNGVYDALEGNEFGEFLE